MMTPSPAPHERPEVPLGEELAALPPDGGEQWNRLVFEQSPYLLQHAGNPVDWFPWGDEAFEKASREDKPVFLSVGYSTCHWCHVMEREAFEDDEVAAVLNEHMVAVKVDREERPDIDQVYMTVTQALTGRGGWPMTVVLTPEKKPFFAGTYFPKRGGAYGGMGMMELIPALARAWKQERGELVKSADHIAEVIGNMAQGNAGDLPGRDLLDRAFDQYSDAFDNVHGGFAERPKFPVPHNLMFLLRRSVSGNNEDARAMVEFTLRKMRLGGIYDHVGLGFHRYSTDEVWLLPHFEKMLYDQALMTMAYVEAFAKTRNEEYARTANEIIGYVLRDMTSPEGGFYSAEDADSEGVEGKFYVWTAKEIEDVLGAEDAELFKGVFNIENEGNFFDEATHRKSGENIPHLRKDLSQVAQEMKLPKDELASRLHVAREKLFDHREKRVHPYKDDKILTDWNGLMIAALAKAAKALDSEGYAQAAMRAADFVLDKLRRDDGRLLKRYRAGRAGLAATLEDYAFFVWGLIELYEASFDFKYLHHAAELTDTMIGQYGDAENGGFFMTAADSEKLLVRSKDAYDGAIPSGNAVAAYNLARLARFTGRESYADEAARTVRAFAEGITKVPMGHSMMLIALEFIYSAPMEIVLAGDRDDEVLMQMARSARERFLPNAVLLHRPAGEHPPVARLAKFTEAQVPISGRPTAYICENRTCQKPVQTHEDFIRALDQGNTNS